MTADPLDAQELWFSVERAVENGRACRDYRIRSAEDALLATARAFPWRRPIPVADASGQPILTLERRRSFPLTGRVDVRAAASGPPLGIVRRNGRYEDALGRPAGAFRDARSIRGRTHEALFIGLLDTVLGDGGSEVSGPSGYVWLAEGRPAGTLRREPLPFSQPPVTLSGIPARLARVVPERMRRRFRTLVGPTGWKLERLPEAPVVAADPRLTLAAALFAIELSYW